MPLAFATDDTAAIPVHDLQADQAPGFIAALPDPARAWAGHQGFTGALGQALVLPDALGGIAQVLVGYGTSQARARGRFHIGTVARQLPKGVYRIA